MKGKCMKILVTGGAGYLGSIMVGELLKKNYDITVLDNFMYHQNSLSTYFANEKFKVIQGDVRDSNLLKSEVSKTDVIIPLAAIVGAPACDMDPIAATSINKNAILEMLKFVSSDQLILMPTTNSAYGQGDENNFCDETSPLNPLSQYAKEKVEVENEIMARKNSVSFRLATVFGMSPRMRLDLLVNEFVLRALKDKFVVLFEGDFKRNYVHVRDVAQSFLLALDNIDKFSGQIFNVGLSEANISKKELCLKIKELIPDFYYTESPISKDPDQRNYVVSNKKIEKQGFVPQFGLERGLKELIMGITTLHTRNFTNTRR
jgi:nucleoside-diphosphate-sugar epimerase